MVGRQLTFLLGFGNLSGVNSLLNFRGVLSSDFLIKSFYQIGVEPKNRGILPPKWMVYFMEIPMNKWMIWGVNSHDFWVGNTQISIPSNPQVHPERSFAFVEQHLCNRVIGAQFFNRLVPNWRPKTKVLMCQTCQVVVSSHFFRCFHSIVGGEDFRFFNCLTFKIIQCELKAAGSFCDFWARKGSQNHPQELSGGWCATSVIQGRPDRRGEI